MNKIEAQISNLEIKQWATEKAAKWRKDLKMWEYLSDLWGNIKQNYIHVIDVPEGVGKKDQKNYLKK